MEHDTQAQEDALECYRRDPRNYIRQLQDGDCEQTSEALAKPEAPPAKKAKK